MEEITIITENKVGVLAKVCGLLGSAGVNIEAISAQGLGDSGLIRLITGDTVTAKKALTKAGFTFKTGNVIIIKLNDAPGELYKVTRKLAQAGVDIESLYLLSKSKGLVEVAIKAADESAARKALK
ncbi:MAG: ACT domain-containing protein [Candidatus Micrarchaeota archaeon]|nr:ACT domain-containing protein [Candidatus Micrarchaeota archaeon]